MRYKKIVLSIIASVLGLGLLSGCGGYSHDFNSSEEAQKYVLAKLKDKYNEEFTIKEVKKYKEEKIGLNWISVEVSSKENSSQTSTVYARNTGLFKDGYHVYYYSDEIETSIYLNDGKTDEEYAEEISHIMQEIVESNLVLNISVYTNDDNIIFYSLPEQHSQPDVEVILEKMEDVRSLQETKEDYKEWKKQNQNNAKD